MKRTDLQGSPPQIICDVVDPRGGAWGPGGTIIFAPNPGSALQHVDAGGGTPKPLTTLDRTRKEQSHRWPVFLPDGRHVLFLVQTGEATARDDSSAIEVLALDDGARTRLVRANSSPLYSPEGFVLFWREGALRAQAFDAKSLTVSGDIFPVAADAAFDATEHALASVATGGVLVYSTAAYGDNLPDRSSLLVVDRTGRSVKTIAESVLVEGGIALSHDGTRLAVSLTAEGARNTDIWVYDLARGTSGRLTFEEGGELSPVWSFDDSRVLYSSEETGSYKNFIQSASGQGQRQAVASDVLHSWPVDWSRDSRLAGPRRRRS